MPITGDVIIRAGRLIRRVLLFAALALATIPAAAHAAPGLEFSPSSPVVFGNTTVGQSSEQVLTLTNTSSPPQSVNIFGRVLSGADAGEFSLGPNTCPPTLAQGASCTFSVRFNPSHPGNSTAQLEVNNNKRQPASRPATERHRRAAGSIVFA
ncbi:MAG: choice-of-anchor D domain-containing protein [Actinomycetota bacterium]|nr:choice-of-anchor D domain-containing protein [Actinomycetota bacterium]